MTIAIVVAVSENNAIGKDNQLLWHLPADLKHFKRITTGNTIIMGRKTYDSIGRPLPNRRNIVISRNEDLKIEGVEVVSSLKDAVKSLSPDEKAYIIGGGEIYKEALPLADTVYLTKVHHHFDADTFFPNLPPNEWEIKEQESHQADDKNEFSFTFLTLLRRKSS